MNAATAAHWQPLSIQRRADLVGLLDRFGLRRPLIESYRWLTSRAERERWRIMSEDYRSCAKQWREVAAGAPAGDARRRVWMMTSIPAVWGLKLEGVLALALRHLDFRPQIVELSSNTWGRRYHRLFGNRDFLDFRGYRARLPALPEVPEFLDLVRSNPDVTDLMRLTYRQVDVGRIVLSNLLYRHKFAGLDLSKPETLQEVYADLVNCQRNVGAAESMLEANRPEAVMVMEKGLSPAAEVYGVCISHGVPVIQYSNSQNGTDFILKRYSMANRHQHPFSLDPVTWERAKTMAWTDEDEAELMRTLADAYLSGTWFNRKFLHQDKQIKPAAEVRQQIGLDPSKKTAVIFSHVLWDATFFYGEGLFPDYESWLLETVRSACANPRLNWVIKLHPDLVWKLKYEGFTGELRDVLAMRSAVGTLPDHVKLVLPDTDISTYSFFEITDYCITVRGTIGIEMACHGVPVITGGTGRYSNMGFTVDSASRAEYLARLASLETQPPMTRGEVELARRYAHTVFNLRPWQLRSAEMTRMPRDSANHPLEMNIEPRTATLREFSGAPDIRAFQNWFVSPDADYLEGGA